MIFKTAGGLLVFPIVALAGGGMLYYFTSRRPKRDVLGSTDLSEYDFDDVDDKLLGDATPDT